MELLGQLCTLFFVVNLFIALGLSFPNDCFVNLRGFFRAIFLTAFGACGGLFYLSFHYANITIYTYGIVALAGACGGVCGWLIACGLYKLYKSFR